jgi:hypothetical protein
MASFCASRAARNCSPTVGMIIIDTIAAPPWQPPFCRVGGPVFGAVERVKPGPNRRQRNRGQIHPAWRGMFFLISGHDLTKTL